MARRRRDRWSLGPALSLPEAARGGPDYDVAPPDPVLAWVQFPDRILEVEARAIAYTERAVLVEWGHGQAVDCAWVWRDAVRAHSAPGWESADAGRNLPRMVALMRKSCKLVLQQQRGGDDIGIAVVVIAALSFSVQVTQWIGGMTRNRKARHRK